MIIVIQSSVMQIPMASTLLLPIIAPPLGSHSYHIFCLSVSNLRTRNIELQVIGRHQQCIIDADKETISMLKAELESLPI